MELWVYAFFLTQGLGGGETKFHAPVALIYGQGARKGGRQSEDQSRSECCGEEKGRCLCLKSKVCKQNLMEKSSRVIL